KSCLLRTAGCATTMISIESPAIGCAAMGSPIPWFTSLRKTSPCSCNNLKIELFVDDRHENCADVATETDALVLMPHRPYNQAFEHPRVRRIRELDELFDCVANG